MVSESVSDGQAVVKATGAIREPRSAYDNIGPQVAEDVYWEFHSRGNTSMDLKRVGIREDDLSGRGFQACKWVAEEAFERQDGNVVVLYSDEKFEEEGDGVLTIPYLNRMSPGYREMVVQKFDAVGKCVDESPVAKGGFVTLSPRLGPEGDIFGQLELMGEVVNQVMAAIRAKYECDFYPAWVLEPQESGNPHVHLLLPVNGAVVSGSWLSGWWRRNGYGGDAGVDIDRMDRGNSGRMVASYVAKYMTDRGEGLGEDEKAFIGALTLTGRREYTIGHNLMGWVQEMVEGNPESFGEAVVLALARETKSDGWGSEYDDWEYWGVVGESAADVIREAKPPPDEMGELEPREVNGFGSVSDYEDWREGCPSVDGWSPPPPGGAPVLDGAGMGGSGVSDLLFPSGR